MLTNGSYKFKKMWESENDNNFSKKDKVQGKNIIELKFKMHDTYKKKKTKQTLNLLMTKMLETKLI